MNVELRRLAAGALGVGDAPPNLSIVLGDSIGRVRPKHQLHVQGRLSSLISGDGGLIRAVIRALGALAAEPAPGTIPLFDAFLVVASKGVALAVDGQLADEVRQLTPNLRRRGWRVVQPLRLDISPERGIAMLPDAAAAIGVSRPALDARWPLERGDDDLIAGEVPIDRLVYAGRTKPESRADAVADMLPMLRDRSGRVSRTAVADLAGWTSRLQFAGAPIGDPTRVASLLELS